MVTLSKYLDGYFSCSLIDLNDKKWHSKAKIPSEPGWYFIRSNTPVDVLCKQEIWQKTYTTKIKKELKPVLNYNLAGRAQRYSPDLSSYWNLFEVYSGMASDLMARAREHSFPDPGTGGLALSCYPALKKYEWLFGYITLNRFKSNASCNEMLLRLGEQIWRSKHGWPILCAE
jgi:hypothetical protein